MIHASGCGVALAGYGIYMTDTGDNWTITGDIENYDTGLKIDGDSKGITLSNLHFEGNKDYHFDIEDSLLIILNNVKCATADIGKSLSKIKNVQGISINDSQLFQCTIYPGVTGTISNGEGWPGYGINDLTGGGIEYLGYRSYLYTSGEGINPGGLNKQNLLNNTFLDRWNAAGFPDGWTGVSAGQTWTQCGLGKTDTTKSRTDYCGKIVTASGSGTISTSRDLHSEAVAKWLLGKTITGAIHFMVPSGQTFTYNAATLYLQVTVPNWVSNTVYNAGDAVYANGNTMAVCVRPRNFRGCVSRLDFNGWCRI